MYISVLMCSMLLFSGYSVKYYAFMVQRFLYLLHMVYLDYQIQCELKKIGLKLRSNSQINSNLFVRKRTKYTKEKVDFKIRAIGLVEIYGKYFQLHIFNLCPINRHFVLMTIIFMMNYVLLLTQTTI